MRHLRVRRLAALAASVLAAAVLGPVASAQSRHLLPGRPTLPIIKPPDTPYTRLRLDSGRFFPESDLRNGQEGYALTVFQGTKIEKFNVKILGLLRKVNSGKDLILIRVTSGPSVHRQINIAAGMSGSPVYIDGRMIGAIAYSLPFAREPIGLVTPIGDMLDAWDPDLPSKPDVSMAEAMAGTLNPVAVGTTALLPYLGRGAMPASTLADPGAMTTFEPVATPVMVSGMNPAGIARLAGLLGPLHLTPMAGGGMPSSVSAAERKAATLVPGASVGVSLIQGDVDMTAIGTLTFRDHDKIIAFGHPFTGIGPVDAALTTASIADIFPSFQDSTKLGSPLETIGRIFQDRPFSVGGEIGQMPHMVPMTVHVDDESNKRVTDFHARIINHPLLTGPLVLQVAQQAVVQTHGTPGDAIAYVTTTVNADQVGKIVRHNVFYDALSIDQSAIGDLDSLVRVLSSNPFYPLAIRSVEMSVIIKSSHATAQVDHIFVPKVKYQPGDTVDVGVVLKPYKSEPVLRHVSLVIPQTVPDGSVTLSVRGGGAAGGSTISLGGTTITLRSSQPAGPTPSNVNQLVKQYLEQPKNNDLVATLQLPTTAITVQGEDLSLLPPTMSSVMRSAHSTGLRVERDEVKTTTPVEWVLSGQQSLTLTVARKNVLDNSSPSGVSPSDTSPDTSVTTPGAGDDGALGSDSGASTSSSADASEIGYQPMTAGPVTDAVPVALAPAKPPVPAAPDAAASAAPAPISSTTQTASTSSDAGNSASADKRTVGRLASVWRQSSAADFAQGTLDGATITSANDLRLALALHARASSTSSYVWSLATDAHGVTYAGTGDEGIIYKVGPNGTMTPFYRTKELEVTALAFGPDGSLYAGTSPHGAIFKITPNGTGTKIFTTSEKYVTALAIDGQSGRLYASSGGGVGKVYQIPLTGGSGNVFFASQEAHLLSLAVGANGTVYAGGSPDGIIYAITPDGKGKVLYDATQANITALATGSDGTVYAGTSPFGVLYKITPGTGDTKTAVKSLAARPKSGVTALQTDASGNVWATSGDSVYCVTPDNTAFTYTAPTDVAFLSLSVGPSGQILVGTGSSAQVYALGSGTNAQNAGDTGTYTSPVHDAKHPAHWGTITWASETPQGATLAVQTRSGDVPRPDDTWSPWSASYTDPSGENVLSPPARYLQYRVLLASSDPQARADATPRLSALSIYYLTQNQPPAVKVAAPASGDAVSGTTTIRWNSYDADHDTLAYDVYYSADDGKTFLPLPKSHLSGPSTSAPTTTGAPDDAARSAALTKELDKHPEIPAGVRAQMLQQAAMMSHADASAASPATSSHLSTTSLPWDTHTLPDGTYRIKVIASDAQSNPTDPRTGESVSNPFLVVNTPPVLTVDAQGVAAQTTDANGIVHAAETLHGVAASKLCFIKTVQYVIDGGPDAYAAAPDDGLFDSGNEPFTITIDLKGLAAGLHQVSVQAFDQAGNVSKQQAAFEVK